MKVTCRPDCGNSPKKQLLKDFNIAYAKGDTTFLAERVIDDIVWNRIGDKIIDGIEMFTEELERMKSEKVSEVVLKQILSHGKEGAVSGILIMQDGKQYAFSDFYHFSGAKNVKIKSISSQITRL